MGFVGWFARSLVGPSVHSPAFLHNLTESQPPPPPPRLSPPPPPPPPLPPGDTQQMNGPASLEDRILNGSSCNLSTSLSRYTSSNILVRVSSHCVYHGDAFTFKIKPASNTAFASARRSPRDFGNRSVEERSLTFSRGNGLVHVR